MTEETYQEKKNESSETESEYVKIPQIGTDYFIPNQSKSLKK